MVSAITERPYTFLRWLTGTLPGRKPLRRTLSLRSTRRASALASRSDAGTLIWNSCFNPSARVSVTCMASIFFPLGPAERRDFVNLVDARQNLRRWFGEPNPSRETYPLGDRFLQYRHANAVSAWCGRRDSNPHNFRHWNLNPARLPVPPRPREKHPIRPRCRERRAYNMRPHLRSKKMAFFATFPGMASQLDRTI